MVIEHAVWLLLAAAVVVIGGSCCWLLSFLDDIFISSFDIVFVSYCSCHELRHCVVAAESSVAFAIVSIGCRNFHHWWRQWWLFMFLSSVFAVGVGCCNHCPCWRRQLFTLIVVLGGSGSCSYCRRWQQRLFMSLAAVAVHIVSCCHICCHWLWLL